MIYIGKVRPAIMEPPIGKDILQFFKDYNPIRVEVPDDAEKQKELKTIVADGFISGEMVSLSRKNENVESRDCLILDLDDVIVSREELIESIQSKMAKFEYILYPSISHGIKGVRYRLVVPLDDHAEEEEYKQLIEFFLKKVMQGIINNSDHSNLTWSQIQLLPVFTQYIDKNDIIISGGEKKFPKDIGVEAARNWAKDHNTKNGVSAYKTFKSSNFKKGGSRYRNTTTELFESIVCGCEEGNRNNRIAQITGGLLARAVDVKAVFELVKIANRYFSEPLSEKEVEETFYSIAKKELGAN